jgi:hypothetical protein
MANEIDGAAAELFQQGAILNGKERKPRASGNWQRGL